MIPSLCAGVPARAKQDLTHASVVRIDERPPEVYAIGRDNTTRELFFLFFLSFDLVFRPQTAPDSAAAARAPRPDVAFCLQERGSSLVWIVANRADAIAIMALLIAELLPLNGRERSR